MTSLPDADQDFADFEKETLQSIDSFVMMASAGSDETLNSAPEQQGNVKRQMDEDSIASEGALLPRANGQQLIICNVAR